MASAEEMAVDRPRARLLRPIQFSGLRLEAGAVGTIYPVREGGGTPRIEVDFGAIRVQFPTDTEGRDWAQVAPTAPPIFDTIPEL